MESSFRLLKAVDMMSRPNGTTYKELQEQFGISYRSAQRLVEDVEQLFPLTERSDNNSKCKRWLLIEEYVMKLPNLNIPSIELTPNEVIALSFMMSRSDILKNTGLAEDFERAFNKLFAIDKKAEKKRFFENLKTVMLLGDNQKKDYSGKEEILNDLFQSMLNNKKCRISYHSFNDDKIKEMEIQPLYLFQRKGGLYLFSKFWNYDDVRVIAVERIKKLELLDETFIPPLDFNAQESLDTTFSLIFEDQEDYKIKFSADQAKYIQERRWTKEQSIEILENGDLLLSMKTSGWYDVKCWVLSYGSHAEVLEPEELRDEIKSELEASIENYK